MTVTDEDIGQVRQRASATLQRLVDRVDAAMDQARQTDDAELEKRYEEGCARLVDERYAEALDLFAEIVQARLLEPRYLFAFGLCLQHFGQIQKAMEYFGAAYALDASDAAAAYRLGECFYALGHDDDAREALQIAVTLCALPENDPNVRLLATQLLDTLAQAGG